MHSILSASALLSLALFVVAAPCNQEAFIGRDQFTMHEVIIEPTANAGLYLCENTEFRGYCVHYTTPFGQCNTITDRFPPGDRAVSSAGADRGSWCTLYAQEGCRGEELQVHYPGYENLGPLGWQDKPRSYNCAQV